MTNLTKLREMDSMATPAPWVAGPCKQHAGMTGQGLSCDRLRYGEKPIYHGHGPDTELIAAMRNALPALLAIVDAAKEESRRHGESSNDDCPCTLCNALISLNEGEIK